MNGYEKKLTETLVSKSSTVQDLRNILIDMTRNSKMRVNKLGFNNLVMDIKKVIREDKLPARYIKHKDIDVIKLSKYIYHVLCLMQDNIGKFGKYENTEGLDENRTCWTRVDSKENSSVSIYTVSNAIEILQTVEAIKKVRDANWRYSNCCANTCARYNLLDKAIVEYLEFGDDYIYVQAPDKLINKYIRKIQNVKDYEVCVMASTLATTVDNRIYKRACDRLKAHKRNLLHHSPDTSPKSLELEANEKYGLDVRTSRVIKQLFEFDITTIAAVHHDSYGGRLYHKWSTVKKEIREKAKLRGALKNMNLAEIDLSQCNFYILLMMFCKETGYSPNKLLSYAVSQGRLREVIAIAAEGQYEDTICGEEIEINFDEIRNLRTAKKYKKQLKLFFLKASNCKFGAEAGHIMDKALSVIDARFASWIRNYRKGFTIYSKSASGKQSVVPYKTQQNEVEFMYGYKMHHELPTKEKSHKIIKETDYTFKRTEKGVIDFLIEQGVKFFLPIHDAIIVTKDCINNVLEAIEKAATQRSYGIPAVKIIDYKSGKEERLKGTISKLAEFSSTNMSLGAFTEDSEERVKKIVRNLSYCFKTLKKYHNE